MKPKTKVLTAVLLCCALVAAFTACAGCTGTDPIVGTWVKTYSDDSKIIYEFVSPEVAYLTIVDKNGVVTTSDKADGMYTKVMKTGDNRYESGLIIFSVSEDGYTMTETFSDGDTVKFTKYSNYNVPTATPTTKATVSPTSKATTSTSEPILGTWKHSYNNGNACYYEFKSDGSYTATVKGTNSVDKFTLSWIKLGDNHYQTSLLNMDDFYVNSDGSQLTIKTTDSDGTVNEEVYTRVSASEVPAATTATVSPTKTATPTPTTTSSGYSYKLEVLETKSGKSAEKAALERTEYNPVAGIGEKAYLVKVKLTYTPQKGDDKTEHAYPLLYLKMYVDGVGYMVPSSLIVPDKYPLPDDDILSNGESVTGWMYFIVPDSGVPKLQYNDYGLKSNYATITKG